METCCKSCGRIIVYDEKQSGRRPEYCDDTCRQRGYRANHPRRGRGRHREKSPLSISRHSVSEQPKTQKSSPLATPRQIQPFVPIVRAIKVPAIPIIHHLRHKLVFEHSYTCMVCGWSWIGLPERECPGGCMYSQENKPSYLLTLDQLKQQDLRPGGMPDAFLYRKREPGWNCLYDMRKAVPR